MGWRSHYRARILDDYRGQARSRALDDRLGITTTVYQNKAETFDLRAVTLRATALFPVPDSYEIRATLHDVSSGQVQLQFQSRLVCLPLFQDEMLVTKVISVDDFSCVAKLISVDNFSCLIHRFSFQRRASEPKTSLFDGMRKAGPRLNVPRVPRPPTPPSFHKADLEEKLRWILTPPIHEVLSDPQLCLPAKPYPFQTCGIKWLYDRDSALLADEMGLGKTMQALIAARLLWREGLIAQILVICPKTLISTWQTEIEKWWPQIAQNVMLPGYDRQFFLRLGTPNVIVKIINYEAIAREGDWLEEQAFSHDLVIIDEAQRIKNPESKTSRAVKQLQANRRWALTGTPLENKVDDVCSIFGFVRPGFITTNNQASLRARIIPYMLRRRAEEVMDELPEKSDYDMMIELDDQQRSTYDQMEQTGVDQLNAQGERITVVNVFALITKLRQFCNFDPASGQSAKLERLLEDLAEVRDSGRKALVFSQFVDERFGLKRLAERMTSSGYKVELLHGEVRPNQRASIVDAFRSDGSIDALLLNYKVGGVGLNLQAANYVFLFDRWWNPAVEDQAVKRAHRIGQTQKVFIRRFYCKDTIEERILRKLAEKRRLFRNVIDEARPDPDSLGLTEEEIFSLFNLTVRPRKKTVASPPKVKLNLDGVDPAQFEVLITQLYEKQGYTVHHTGGPHDAGIDILAERNPAGGLERVIVQCKHQHAKVGRPTLQQLWGVLNSDQSYTRADLVTSSWFTAEATAFAEGKRLTLIDRTMLMQLAEEYGVADFDERS